MKYIDAWKMIKKVYNFSFDWFFIFFLLLQRRQREKKTEHFSNSMTNNKNTLHEAF